jgi:hypothetical protein
MHRPDITKEYCEVSYTLPGSSTGLEVRGFKVQKSTPERWVKYEIHYRYRVQMFPHLSIDWAYYYTMSYTISHCYAMKMVCYIMLDNILLTVTEILKFVNDYYKTKML